MTSPSPTRRTSAAAPPGLRRSPKRSFYAQVAAEKERKALERARRRAAGSDAAAVTNAVRDILGIFGPLPCHAEDRRGRRPPVRE